MNCNIWCWIPARSGSQGFKDKNIQLIEGKPLLAHAIHRAKRSVKEDETWSIAVDTDSQMYAAIADKAGATVLPLRPAHLAEHTTPWIDPLLYRLDQLKAENMHPQWVVALSCTTPLLHAHHIQSAIALCKQYGPNYASIAVVGAQPATWNFSVDANNTLLGHRPKRRQQDAQNFRLCGGIYVASPEFIRENGGFFVPQKTLPLNIPTWNALDIETRDDWLAAKALYPTFGEFSAHNV